MTAFDSVAQRWGDVDASGNVARDELTVSTYNVWFDSYFADERYHAIAELLSRASPDVMVFQEITSDALAVFRAQPWIRESYFCASIVGAEFTVNGSPLLVCSVHLESGKQNAGLRARQLGSVYRATGSCDDAIVLGDFNMRDDENGGICAPYVDVWPALRPNDPGFTENTTINHMRFDSRNKERHVRFDRVLLQGSAWSASAIVLLGTEPVSPELPRVFPSDHFGVWCRLNHPTATAPAPTARRRRWPRWWRRSSR